MKTQRVVLVLLGAVILVVALLIATRPESSGSETSRATVDKRTASSKGAFRREPAKRHRALTPLEDSEEVRSFRSLLSEWEDPGIRTTENLFEELQAAIGELSAEEAAWFVNYWTRSEQVAAMKDPLLGWMAGRWVEADPVAVASLLAGRGASATESPVRAALFRKALGHVRERDPQRAFAIYLSARTELAAQGLEALPAKPASLFEDFAGRDPTAAWSALFQLEGTEQLQALGGFCLGLPDRADWSSYAEKFVASFVRPNPNPSGDIVDNSHLPDAAAHLARRWSDTDEDAAMNWFYSTWVKIQRPSGVESEADRVSVVFNGAQKLRRDWTHRDLVTKYVKAAELGAEEEQRILDWLGGQTREEGAGLFEIEEYVP